MKTAVLFDLEDTLVLKGEYGQVAHAELIRVISDLRQTTPCETDKLFQKLRCQRPSDIATYESLGLSRERLVCILDELDPGPIVEATPQAEVMLQVLRRLGVRLAIVTNAPCRWAGRLLSTSGIDAGLFDAIVTLCDVDSPKPHRGPLRLALRRLRVRPERATMIGDRDDVDLVPARELGIATILVAKDIPLLYRFPDVMKLIVET